MTPGEIVARIFAECTVLPKPLVLPYGTRYGPYLKVGVDHITSPDTGEISLLPALVDLFTEARRIHGRPIPVTAGWRSVAHALNLEAAGYKAAKLVSPHCMACALDCDALPVKDAEGNTITTEAAVNVQIRTALAQAANRLKLPMPRFGHAAYGERFTHVDLAFLLFEPYTPLPHPKTWMELEVDERQRLSAWVPGVHW